jgi:hypothetical protein
MHGSEPGSALRDTLRRLQGVAQALRHSAQQLSMPPLTALQDVSVTLGARAALRRRRCPAAYVLDWQRYLLDPLQRLSPRAVRYLCWEPAVATDARFQTYLDTAVGALSSHALQGLVWCCHTCWSPAFAAGAVAQRVCQRLATYAGVHGTLTHWRQHAATLLGPAGPGDLAAILIAERAPIATFCNVWAIDERSPYVLAVLQHALPQCLQEMVQEPALRSYLLTTLLPWSRWTLQDFYAAIGATVLHPVTASTDGMPEQLTKLVLADVRLGDPRLPSQTHHWLGLPQEVRQQFVQWLSTADITFFFERVLPESKDQEERKTFWLRYVPHVLRSRPLLYKADVLRLQPLLDQMTEQVVHFGSIDGSTSAFILDFGAVVVVQVSDLRDACYAYGKSSFEQLVPDFWWPQPFKVDGIAVANRAATIQHHQTWEKDLAEILALCDIRPTYKDTSKATA